MAETPSLNSTVGRRLRELRLERGLAQGELARRLGISPAYLSLIEKGRRTVQLPLLWKALELLDVDPEPFIRSLGERPVEQSLGQLLDELSASCRHGGALTDVCVSAESRRLGREVSR